MFRNKKLVGAFFGLAIVIIGAFGIWQYSSKPRFFIDSANDGMAPGKTYYVRCRLPDIFSDDVQVYISEHHGSSAAGGLSWTKYEYSFTVSSSEYKSAMKAVFGSNWWTYEMTHIYHDVEAYSSPDSFDFDHTRMLDSLIDNLGEGQDLDAIAEVTYGPDLYGFDVWRTDEDS